jgi:CubicO group peptidase (beta-lactamase class C family)
MQIEAQDEKLVEVNESVEARGGNYPIRGSYDEAFRPVLDAFIENFREEDEIGSSASIVLDGRTIVDLWGGWKNGDRSSEWERGTTVCMMSVAKGITGIAFNMLVDRGLVDVDAPVADYWPEFAQAGKAKIPVRYILDHRAGIPVLTNNKLWPGAMFDRESYVKALEQQEPLWEPGTVAAYHVHNQGFLLGEIMRRVTGKTVGPFVRSEISGPLRAEYQIGGMTEAEQAEVAEVMPNMEARLFAAKDAEDANSLRGLAFRQNPEKSWYDTMNSREWRESEIASGNGHGNARGVARIYGAVVREEGLDGVKLLSREGLEKMITEQHNITELLQERPYHQALGVLLNTPVAVYMGPNPRAFGHHGLGGSIGFGDPDARLGFSYACNKMHAVGTNGPRARRLIDALYSVIG